MSYEDRRQTSLRASRTDRYGDPIVRACTRTASIEHLKVAAAFNAETPAAAIAFRRWFLGSP